MNSFKLFFITCLSASTLHAADSKSLGTNSFIKQIVYAVYENSLTDVQKVAVQKLPDALYRNPYPDYSHLTKMPLLMFAQTKAMAELLIEHKADVNATVEGMPLIQARMLCLPSNIQNKQIIRLLLENKADINAFCSTPRQQTALYAAVAEYMTYPATVRDRPFLFDMIKLLLAHKADVDKGQQNGITPLHCIATHNCNELFDLLIEHKADVTMRNHAGDTPLHCAAGSKKSHYILSELIERKADIMARNNNKESPRDIAYMHNNKSIIKLLTPQPLRSKI